MVTYLDSGQKIFFENLFVFSGKSIYRWFTACRAVERFLCGGRVERETESSKKKRESSFLLQRRRDESQPVGQCIIYKAELLQCINIWRGGVELILVMNQVICRRENIYHCNKNSIFQKKSARNAISGEKLKTTRLSLNVLCYSFYICHKISSLQTILHLDTPKLLN